MKARIVADFGGITVNELKDALQGLRNVEQEDPARIAMFLMVDAPDLNADQTVDIIKGTIPPLEFIKKLPYGTHVASNRKVDNGKKGGVEIVDAGSDQATLGV